MKISHIVLTVSACLILSSCARKKQVWFTGLQETHLASNKNTIRIYLDREGYFYPDRLFYVPEKDFFDPYQGGKLDKDDVNIASLRYYFTGNRTGVNARSIYKERISKLVKHYSLVEKNSNLETFNSLQNLVLTRLSDSINNEVSKLSTKTLVVLINGFNDTNPTGDYNRIKKYIIKKYKKDYIFLEVYWDGLTANNGDPKLERIWAKAQTNTPAVAAGLRMLFKKVDKATKVKIITHSSGGIVGTSFLFDALSKWKNPKGLNRYYDIVKTEFAPNQNDIRLGMLAPALPGVSTFTDFSKRGMGVKVNQSTNNITKVIIGHNCNDYAVTKRFAKSDFLSTKFGATSLGSNYENEFDKTKKELISQGYSSAYVSKMFVSNPFNIYNCNEKDEEHSWYYYMQNTEPFNSFLDYLFID